MKETRHFSQTPESGAEGGYFLDIQKLKSINNDNYSI